MDLCRPLHDGWHYGTAALPEDRASASEQEGAGSGGHGAQHASGWVVYRGQHHQSHARAVQHHRR